METLMKNWKTSLAGLVVLLIYFASAQGFLSVEVRDSLIALGVACGLIAASDAKPRLMIVIGLGFMLSLGSCSFLQEIVAKDNIVRAQGSAEYKILELYFESKVKSFLAKKGIQWDSKSAYVTFNLADKDFIKIFGSKTATFFTKTGSLKLTTEKQIYNIDWKAYNSDSTTVSINKSK